MKRLEQAHLFKESHSQSINKVSWNYEDPNILATASHDGTIKIWDLRSEDHSQETHCLESNESVMEVKFNPR